MIAPRTSIANRPHRVRIEVPGAPVPDGDGGYTQPWLPVKPPEVYVEIRPATAADLERVAAGAVISSASHIVTGPYLAGVTTKARVLFGAREFHVASVTSPEERRTEMILLCTELEPQ